MKIGAGRFRSEQRTYFLIQQIITSGNIIGGCDGYFGFKREVENLPQDNLSHSGHPLDQGWEIMAFLRSVNFNSQNS